MTQYAKASAFGGSTGSSYWRDSVSTVGNLPGTDTTGAVRQTLDTGDFYRYDGGWTLIFDVSASVTGPASSTDNAIVRFNGAGGNTVQNTSVIIDDSNNMSGVVNFSNTGTVTLTGLTADTVPYLNGSKVLTSSNISSTELGYLDGAQDNIQEQISHLASTGIQSGGDVSIATTTTFDVAAGEALFVDHSTNPPTRTLVNFGPFTGESVPDITGDTFTLLEINSSGTLVKSGETIASETDRWQKVQIGVVTHPGTTLEDVFSDNHPASSPGRNLAQLSGALGPITKSGGVFSGTASNNLKLDRSAGEFYQYGGNWLNDKNIASIISTSLDNNVSFRYIYRDGLGGFTVGAATTDIDPNNYDDGSGTLATVTTNKYQIQYIYYFPQQGTTYIHYGQETYTQLDAAVGAAGTETISHLGSMANAHFRAFLIVKQGTTNLNNTSNVKFLTASKLGIASGGAAVAGTVNLQSAYTNSANPEITLDSAKSNPGVSIYDDSTPITGNLFEIMNNAGSTTYFGVDTSDAKFGVDLDVSAAGAWNIGASVGANNLTIGGASSTVVIAGNLQVDGTTTTVNSTTLDVADANITINDGGNQASADGTSGITVEMSDATDVTIKYDSTLASRWKAGDSGSEVELANVSSTQTFANKTFDADLNTITNIENADIKAGAGIDAAKIHNGSVSNTEFGYLNGVTSAIQTQLNAKLDDFAGTTDNAIIRTNGVSGDSVQESGVTIDDSDNIAGVSSLAVGGSKDASAIIDMTSTTQGLGLPSMTTAQRTAISAPKTGLKVYDTTTSSEWTYNGSSWVEITSGFANPMTTNGDIIYGGSSGSATRLAIGTKGQKLKAGSSSPEYGWDSINSISSSYTILDNDGYDEIIVTTGATDYTVTLPTVADNTGRVITIIKADTSTGNVIIDGEGAETINDDTTRNLRTKYNKLKVISDGSKWVVLDYFASISFTADGNFTAGTVTVQRVNDVVTLTFESMTHSSNSVPTDLAAIPSWARATTTIRNAFTWGAGSFSGMVETNTSGDFLLRYYSAMGTAVARTTSTVGGCITYSVV